jgi:hypothetical protein
MAVSIVRLIASGLASGLVRVPVFLVICFTIGIGGVAAGARERTDRQALASLFTNLDNTHCLRPCLFGIRPDTPYDQARAILELRAKQYGYQPQYYNGRLIMLTGRDIVITLNNSAAGPMVNVSFAPSHTVGELVSVIGPPEAIRVTQTARGSALAILEYTVYLFYNTKQFVAEIRNGADRLTPEKAFRMLRLVDARQYLFGKDSHWRGFTLWGRYR